jgi:hypothetical protein
MHASGVTGTANVIRAAARHPRYHPAVTREGSGRREALLNGVSASQATARATDFLFFTPAAIAPSGNW